jgi:DNA-binding NarL/FixJ family response regulator
VEDCTVRRKPTIKFGAGLPSTKSNEEKGPAMQINLIVACREWERAVELCTRVEQASDGGVVGQAVGAANLLPRASAGTADVLMLECALDPNVPAWEVLSRVHRVSDATRILMMCEDCTHGMTTAFIQHGASGCMLRSSDPALFVKAVRAVHEGDTWFGRTELVQALRRQVPPEPSAAATDHHESLTAREREIMGFVRDALSNKEIARRLMISDKTVKTHLHHIYVKLQQSGRYKALLSNGTQLPSPDPGPPDGRQDRLAGK